MVFRSEISPMLTVKDVSRFLNIHTNTVRHWSDTNILKAYRITPRGDRRFRKEDIERFLMKSGDGDKSKVSDCQLSFTL